MVSDCIFDNSDSILGLSVAWLFSKPFRASAPNEVMDFASSAKPAQKSFFSILQSSASNCCKASSKPLKQPNSPFITLLEEADASTAFKALAASDFALSTGEPPALGLGAFALAENPDGDDANPPGVVALVSGALVAGGAAGVTPKREPPPEDAGGAKRPEPPVPNGLSLAVVPAAVLPENAAPEPVLAPAAFLSSPGNSFGCTL
mmetsp:Transcript_31537/g.91212  ORF Transcript_31537/g.91212 Transcript_31537/m.91212 type:complete len:205 (-) Transcript_31537:251-865(-)